MRYITAFAIAAGLVVSGCGGGGGGDSGGGFSSPDRVLEVSVTFPRQTLQLFVPAQVQPALSGFEGYTPSCTLASGQIPPGMRLNTNCTITGTPTVQGVYGFALRVAAAGVSNTLDFSGTIGVQGPGIQYPPVSGPVGSLVSSSPNLSWSFDPVPGASWSYSVVSGQLAPGLTLDPASGTISGTLTTQGSFAAQIGATLDSPAGTYQTATTGYTVEVDLPTFSYPPLAMTSGSGVSLLFVGQLAALQPFTDAATTLGSFMLTDGALPPGMALDPATGVILGVPSAVRSLDSFEVEATVSRSGVDNRSRATGRYEIRLPGRLLYPQGNSVRVDATFNTISPVWEKDPLVLSPLSVQGIFQPKPGSCSLPPGVTFVADGRIDGHPTQTGSFQCTFSVTYSASGAQWEGEALLQLEVR